MLVYLDASAAVKLFVEEPESDALVAHVAAVAPEGGDLTSATLLETELRRTARRLQISQVLVSEVLQGFDLVLPDRGTFRAAGLFERRDLSSLDALHLACALACEAGQLVSYDRRQLDAASAVGLAIASPGAAL